MPAPFSRQFLPINTSETQLARRIDDHYHLEMIAENSGQLVACQTQALSLQRDAAIANLRGMAEIAGRQDATNAMLGQTNSLLSCLVGGVDRLNNSMDALNETATQTLDALYEQSEVLQAGFAQIADLMMKQQKTLEEIAVTLSRPYETQALELLSEADRALKTGMKTAGRDQKAEFADASRLLTQVLANPIGSRNYVAWFQTGWLKWKSERDLGMWHRCYLSICSPHFRSHRRQQTKWFSLWFHLHTACRVWLRRVAVSANYKLCFSFNTMWTD